MGKTALLKGEKTSTVVVGTQGTGKGNGTAHPRAGYEDTEMEQWYSSNLSLTSAIDGVDGQRHAPAALPPAQ